MVFARSYVFMKCPVVWVLGWVVSILAFSEFPLAAQSSLVSTGAVWRYLDTGVNQGTNWRATAFDDSAWLSGPAQLGFSSGPAENDETTLLSRINSLGEVVLTYYFRHTFEVAEVAAYSNLLVRLQRDDGAVIYLNGTEVFRSNMPTGAVDYATLAFLAQDDGMAVFAAPVNHSLLLPGFNTLAVEVHQNAPTSSDISFDLELLANVMFQRPAVSITSPTAGTVVGSPTVVLTAGASDVDGTITLVEFLEGSSVLGIASVSPYVFASQDTAPGVHTYTAVAIDSTGLSSTSAPVVIEVAPWLVPSRGQWKYLDDGSEPPASWFSAGFDDSGWSNGIAQFGFGEGDETTPIRRFSTLTGTNIIAYYFRRTFNVVDPAAIGSLSLRLLRDDGAVVYVNGMEVFRNNMPLGAVNSTTTALIVAEDSEFRAVRLNPQSLRAGVNFIAVEVHQVNLTSSDVSFDLELLPNLAPRRPVVAITSPANNSILFGPTNLTINVAARDVDDAIASVVFYVDGHAAGSVTTEPYTLPLLNQLGNYTLLAVATDSTGLSSTSAPVNIGIARVISLISTGAVWKYLDTGVDQGTNWRGTNIDDRLWPSGRGKFGTNDSPITTIRIRNSNNLAVLTSYYRHQFAASNSAAITNLAFRVLRDDGCLAYLNGVEIFRMNMPTGIVTFNTPSPLAMGGADELTFFPTNISAALLREGTNLLAVELHQFSGTIDAGFDLGLSGVAVPPVNIPPLSVEHLGTTVRITWPGTGFLLQEATRPDGPFTNRPSLLNPVVIPSPAGNRYFRLTRP